MRVARERLIFHALGVLEDEVERATHVGRLAPAPHLRLALGYLFAVSDRHPEAEVRGWHQRFWDALTKQSDTDTGTALGFGRWQTLNSSLNGIARLAGMERDHAYADARRRLRVDSEH